MDQSIYPESAAAIAERIRDVRIAMLTTVESDDTLRSHPMTLQAFDPEGCLWFFTSDETDIWQAIASNPNVNVSFSRPDEGLYVSISGHAVPSKERDKIVELWNPEVSAWFSAGRDDPHLVLIKVVAEGADYWDARSSRMVQIFKAASARLTGRAPAQRVGEHVKVDLRH